MTGGYIICPNNYPPEDLMIYLAEDIDSVVACLDNIRDEIPPGLDSNRQIGIVMLSLLKISDNLKGLRPRMGVDPIP